MLEVKLHFAGASLDERRFRVQRWSSRMLNVLGIRLDIIGNVPAHVPGNSLWVANHISWLDVFVINAMMPCQFVAKSEVSGWPLVGWLCRHTGTLFIERENRRDLLRVNAGVEQALREGGSVAFFPEGTTTDGRRLGSFAASLFHAASASQGDVRPVALQYLDAAGQWSDKPAYIDDMSLMQSMWNIAGANTTVARLTLLPVLNAAHINRRELAAEAHRHIAGVITKDH